MEEIEKSKKHRSLREWFWEYASISQIHGFSFINHARGRLLQLVFWILVVLGVIVLCVFYTVGLIQTFIAQPTAVAIATTSNMANFVFPEAVGCVELSFLDYVSQALGGEDEISFNQTLFDFTQSGNLAILQSENTADVGSVLLNLNTSTVGPVPNPSLSDTFAAAAYALLSLTTDFDRGQPQSTSLLVAANLSSVLRIVDLMQAYIDRHNVSYGFLAKVIGTYMCRKLQMQFSTYSCFPTYYSMCDTLDAVVYFGAPGYVPKPHVVCAALSSSNYTPFNNVRDSLFLQSSQAALYSNANTTSISQLNVYFDPRGGQSARDPFHFDALTVGPIYGYAFGGLEAEGRYVWLNRTTSPCGDVDPFTCAETTLLMQIAKNRSCTSLMGIPSSSAPMACRRRYSIAEANQTDAKVAEDNWQEILDGCPQRECDSTRFAPATFVLPKGGGGTNQTSMMVYPQPVLFFTNTEYYLMDGQGFLNAFGGLIGWWIGGSLVAIVHVIVFGVKHVVGRLFARTSFASRLIVGDRFRLLEIQILKIYQEFGSITTFHGFPFLASEINVLAAILWLILLPLCITLTIQETILLVGQYNAVPVQTAISTQSNGTAAFDDAAICIQFLRASMFAPFAPNSTDSFSQSALAFIDSQMEYIRDIGPVHNSSRLAALDPVVMVMFYMMVTAFVDYDTSVPATTAVAYNQTTLDLIDILAEILVENKIDMFQFTKLNAAFICDVVFQLRVVFHKYDIVTSSFIDLPYNPCHDLRLFTWSADNPLAPCLTSSCPLFDYVCVKLPENLTSFATPHDYVSAQVFANPDGSIYALYFDLRHGVGAIDAISYDSQVDTGSFTTSSSAVGIAAESHQYNSSVSPCSDQILFDCALSCFSKNVSTERGCWPLNAFSFAEKPPAMPPCMRHYSVEEAAANSSLTASAVFIDCERACLLPCDSRTYTFTPSSTGVPAANSGVICQVDVHQNAFFYFVYTSEPIMDIWTLLWGIGGLMGLWIGGSAIALIHIPIFLVTAVVRQFSSSCEDKNRGSPPERKKSWAKSYVAESVQIEDVMHGENNNNLQQVLYARNSIYL